MANYTATTRSNYFRVKDAKAFTAWCHHRAIEFWIEMRPESPADDFYAISADTGDCCGWPTYDPAADDEFDFAGELAEHLDPRDVAILFEVGAEKLRYLIGVAKAVHPDGRTISVSLYDIYDRAREAFGPHFRITEGSY